MLVKAINQVINKKTNLVLKMALSQMSITTPNFGGIRGCAFLNIKLKLELCFNCTSHRSFFSPHFVHTSLDITFNPCEGAAVHFPTCPLKGTLAPVSEQICESKKEKHFIWKSNRQKKGCNI